MATPTNAIDAPLIEAGDAAPARSRRRPSPWLTVVIGVIVLPLLVSGGLSALGSSAPDPSTARVVSPAAFQAAFGVRFDLVAVTASGGLVDLRFTVVDETKARNLFHDTASSPALLVEGSGTVLRMRKGMGHGLSLLTGGRYFVLFSNSGGAVQSGTEVSVAIADVRLEPIAATS